MNNVVLVNKDHQGLKATQVEMVTLVLEAMTAVLVDLVLMLESETNCCPYHHNVHVFLHPDLLGHLATVAMMDHPETMAPLATMADLEKADHKAHLDPLDNPDDLETKDHPENPDNCVPEMLLHQAAPDNPDDQDHPDNQADQANPAKPETMEPPANLAAQEVVDNLAAMANPEALETQEMQDHQEAATTAHLPVWHQDIRRKHCRGHIIFSFLVFSIQIVRFDKI
jgi:hypothetical protein